ncbi:MAG: ATP-binding protein [Pseudomonadota bacterium]
MSKHTREDKFQPRAAPWLGAPPALAPPAPRPARTGTAQRRRVRAANARLRDALDLLDEGLCIVDSNWHIVHLNSKALTLMAPGTARASVVGRRLWDACPALHEAALEAALRRALTLQQRGAIAWPVRSAARPLHCVLAPLAGGLAIALRVGAVVPGDAAATATALAPATQPALAALLHTVTATALGISGARFAALFRPAQPGADTSLCALAGEAPAGLDRADPLSWPGVRGESLVRTNDLVELSEHGVCPLPAGGARALGSYLAMPVKAPSGEVIGSLLLGHSQAAWFGAATLQLVQGITTLAALAIDNALLAEQSLRAAAERKRLLDSERAARHEAERANRLKDDFLATLSHELRTPLSAILGWAQVLRRGSRDTQDLQRGLQTIERNARVQAQLIEDLLDVSRITSGKVLLEIEAVVPNTLIAAAIETVRPAADAKGIVLQCSFDAGLSLVAGDPGRLQQVIWNLLSNAIKFTPQGGTVRVSSRATHGWIEITVQDSGVGIKPEFIEHVFERFRQGDASITRRYGGLGLGLAIVKQLTEQHGGSVHAASAGEGQGASFTLRIPRASAQTLVRQRQRAGADALERAGTFDALKVLVVDDAPDGRELVARILSDCRASVVAVGSGAEALRSLQRQRPDVLVSDLAMAGMDGFALLAQVRARAGMGALPAIALTAFAHPDERMRALEAGFQAHIAKPVEAGELIAAIAAVMAR